MSIDLFELGCAESSISSIKTIRKSKCKVSWDNRTQGRSYRPAIQVKRVSLPRPAVVLFDRKRFRPDPDCNKETRELLGKSLYIQRGDLIRELCTLYGASKRVCMMASINMLLKWKSCYKVADTKRFLSIHA